MNHSASSRSVVRAKGLLIALTLVVFGSARTVADDGPKKWECTPAKTPACDCADVNDLINRWNVDNAAIAEYRHQIAGMKAKEALDGKPFMFDFSVYHDKLEPTVNASMKTQFSPGQTSARGGTDGNCETTIDSPTYCLCTVLKAHEDTHYNDCMEYKSNLPGTGYLDYRYAGTMVQVASDEIFGYRTEINRIDGILHNMPAKCKPKQWTGIIDYSETVVTSSSTPIPPNKGAKVLGGTNSTSFSRTQTAVVSVMNGEAHVNTDVTEISKGGQEITSMVKCHGNEQLRENPHHDNSIVTNEAHGYGKAPSFRVNFGGDRYTVSFRTPQVTGTRDQTRDLSPAACGPSYVPKPVNGPYTLGTEAIRLRETASRRIWR